MRLKKLQGTAVLLAILIAAPVPAQNNNKITEPPMGVQLADEPAVIIGGVKITLGEAIKQAIKQNYDILGGSYDVAMADTYYQQFQKKYSIFLNAETGFGYQKYAPETKFFTGKDSKKFDASVALTKIFSSGTMVTAGVKHEYQKQTPMDIEWLDVYDAPGGNVSGTMPLGAFGASEYNNPVFFVSIQQELLKNFLGKNDRRLEKQLKNATIMQKEQIIAMLSMVVVGVIADYWNVAVNKVKVDNAELNLKETRRVRNIMMRNVRLGLADSFNTNYYNMLVSGAEASLAQAKQDYRNALRKFLTTVNMSETVDVAGTVILTNTLPAVDEAAALKSAYEKRADFRSAKLALENAEMELKIKKNEGLPSLTAEVNANTMGYNERFGTSYGDAGKFSYPGIEARLKLSYPLDDREQKVNERNARFKLKQAKISLDKTRRTVRDEMKTSMETIQTSHTLYTKAHNARVQAEAFYFKMLKNLRRGRLDSATVKNCRDAMTQTRQSELEALIYFNLSLLQFEVAKNELWEKYNINVDDYIPKDKK